MQNFNVTADASGGGNRYFQWGANSGTPAKSTGDSTAGRTRAAARITSGSVDVIV